MMTDHDLAASSDVTELDTQTCWRLLERSAIGRFVVSTAEAGPDVYPMNFLVHDGHVFVRSAPGAKLNAISTHPLVAFEVDGEDAHHRWSVVVRGTARRLATEEDIDASGLRGLISWSPTPKHEFVQLTPRTVTGRRFPRRPSASGAVNDESGFLPPARDGALTKPIPIPHLPPLSDER